MGTGSCAAVRVLDFLAARLVVYGDPIAWELGSEDMDEANLMKQFASLDADGSGFLSTAELLAQMPDGNREKASAVLAMMDANADGLVSYREFVEFYFDGDQPEERMNPTDG